MAALRRQVAVHKDMVAEADEVDAERANHGGRPYAHTTLARADALERLLAEAEARLRAV